MPTRTRSISRARNCILSLSILFNCSGGHVDAVPPNSISIPADDTMLDRREGLKKADSPAFQIELNAAAMEAQFACEKHILILLQKAELALAESEKRIPTDFTGFSTIEKVRVLKGFKLIPAITVDIDETVLDNRPEWHKQVSAYDAAESKNPTKAAKDFPFGANTFDPKSNDAWIEEHQATEIKQITNFVRWAKSCNIAVFFITGRPKTQTDVTTKNLEFNKIPFDKVFLRNPDLNQRAEDYKTATRAALEAEGYTIICNIGDQESDLYGLHSLECIKVPNPIYFIK